MWAPFIRMIFDFFLDGQILDQRCVTHNVTHLILALEMQTRVESKTTCAKTTFTDSQLSTISASGPHVVFDLTGVCTSSASTRWVTHRWSKICPSEKIIQIFIFLRKCANLIQEAPGSHKTGRIQLRSRQASPIPAQGATGSQNWSQ